MLILCSQTLHCVSEILLPSIGNTKAAVQWNAQISGWNRNWKVARIEEEHTLYKKAKR
jgi:predicted GIY-YIG superfamily endonuclease